MVNLMDDGPIDGIIYVMMNRRGPVDTEGADSIS